MDDYETEFASIVKLEGGHNYDAWLSSITEYCRAHDLTDHLNGTAVEPEFNKRSRKGKKAERLQAHNELLKLYQEKEEMLRDVLVHTTKAVSPYQYGWQKDDDILPNQKILEEIRAICFESTICNRTTAMEAFLNLEPKDSAQSFFNELDTLLDRMKVRYGIDIPDEIRVPYILTKLLLDPTYLMRNCPGWEALRDEDLSYSNLVVLCLRQDKVLPLVAPPDEARQTYAER